MTGESNSDSIRAAFVEHKGATSVRNWRGPWSVLAEALKRPSTDEAKDGKAICVAFYRQDGGRRRMNNVAGVQLLGFDVDDVDERPGSGQWASVGYTTWSHRREGKGSRWRLLMPLARAVSAQQYRTLYTYMAGALGFEADPSCKDATRLHYLPRAGADAWESPGPWLNPDELPGGLSIAQADRAMGEHARRLSDEEAAKARERIAAMDKAEASAEAKGKKAYMDKALANLSEASTGDRHMAFFRLAIAAGSVSAYIDSYSYFPLAAQALRGLGVEEREGEMERHWRNGFRVGQQSPLQPTRWREADAYSRRIKAGGRAGAWTQGQSHG